MRRNPWLVSITVTALAVAVSLWIWFTPRIPSGTSAWLVAALPFVVGLLAPRVPLLLAPLTVLVPYLAEGQTEPLGILQSLGWSFIAAATGILLRRLFTMGGGDR